MNNKNNKKEKKFGITLKAMAFALFMSQLGGCGCGQTKVDNEKVIEVQEDIDEINDITVSENTIVDNENSISINDLSISNNDNNVTNDKKKDEENKIVLPQIKKEEKTTTVVSSTNDDLQSDDKKNYVADDYENDDDMNKDDEHSHKFSSWKYHNKEKEVSSCSCGSKKYRNHKFNVFSKKTFTTNNDGTHNVKETQNCITCTGKKEKNYIESCNMTDWKYNKESKQEERTCEKCDYTITKLHVHTEPSADLEYVLDKSKNNGKHELKAEYKCEICEEKVTLTKEEDCKLSDWKYNKETKQEERTCKVCDYTITKLHVHTEPSADLEYVLDKSKNNGKHELKAEYKCGICEEKVTLTKEEDCKLSDWKYNKESKQEERTCKVCDYKVTKEHEHSQAPSNLDYSFDKSNNNGTHQLKAIFNCDICKEAITLVKDENCKYGSWTFKDESNCSQKCDVCDHENTKSHNYSQIAGSVTSNPEIGKHNLKEKCDDCNNERQVTVSCQGDGNKYYHTAGYSVSVRENCSVCGDICLEEPHEHEMGQYVVVDDTNHKRTCDCGYESVEGHQYGDWQISGDGSNVRECESCGHTQTFVHSCNLETNREFPSSKTEDYCYENVTRCTIDGCDYEERNKVGHDYNVEVGIFGEVHSCKRCGYTFEIEYDISELSLNSSDSEEKKKNKVLTYN